MKVKIFAAALMVILLTFVTLNTYFVNRSIEKIIDETDNIEIAEDNSGIALEKAKRVMEIFEEREMFVSLSVNHEDLSNAKESLVELVACLKVSDTDGAVVAKDRLKCNLSHLKRLAGINPDAII